jgi:phage tail sheath protein FI
MAFQLSPGVNVTEIDLTSIVPAVATSTGAIAGIFNWGPVNERTLIDTETKLVSIFGQPDATNYETWFTASNFLSYGNSLYVVRAANTSSTAPANTAARNAYANIGTVSTNPVVLNKTDFESKIGTFDTNVMFVAKYPGAMGDSLTVSVINSQNVYSSNIYAAGLASPSAIDVTANVSIQVGSNTAVVYFKANTSASVTQTQANTFGAAFVANLAIGDYVSVGNASIGTQLLQVATIGTPAFVVGGSSDTASANITFTTPYKLSTNYNTDAATNQLIKRSWEYAPVVGTNLKTSDYQATYNPNIIDGVHVVVVDTNGMFSGAPGTILETYTNLSRATDATTVGGAGNYWKDVINQTSKYVWAVNEAMGLDSNTAMNLNSSSMTRALTLNFVGGTNGFTESTAPLSILATGYDKFASSEDVDVAMVLQGKPTGGTTVVNGQTVNNFQLANYIIDNIVEVRKDCIALITPDDNLVKSNPGAEATSLVNWRGALHDSSYAVMDSGYKYMYDRYNDTYRFVPTNGDIAGLCVRTDHTRDPWWSPAGFNRGQIKNLVKLRYNPSKADRDLLYSHNINPVVTFPGQGTILFGDKTLQSKASAFDHINVRRLFIVLEKAIATAAKFFLFEFNDDFTRAQFKALVNPYLRDIQGRRGITDYSVVCDATNNTAEVIDGNKFIGDIYIKPARSINYIQLNFVAVRTGVQFSEIIGKF